MRRVVAATSCVAAVAAGSLLGGCSSSQGTSATSAATPGQPVPASAIHRLTAIADRIVKFNGGAAPVWVSVAVTTHAKALTSATPGDTTAGNEDVVVYLITMKGHFVDDHATGPPGASAPTGSYLSAVLDARTFQSMDFGLSHRRPPVAPSSFGPVTYLKVTSGART